jgi:hypothetical protein
MTLLDLCPLNNRFSYRYLFVYRNIYWSYTYLWGTRWLRHCATNRMIAGSIPDGVTGIFLGYNPSGRTVALGSTQPLAEMSTRHISWG